MQTKNYQLKQIPKLEKPIAFQKDLHLSENSLVSCGYETEHSTDIWVCIAMLTDNSLDCTNINYKCININNYYWMYNPLSEVIL